MPDSATAQTAWILTITVSTRFESGVKNNFRKQKTLVLGDKAQPRVNGLEVLHIDLYGCDSRLLFSLTAWTQRHIGQSERQ